MPLPSAVTCLKIEIVLKIRQIYGILRLSGLSPARVDALRKDPGGQNSQPGEIVKKTYLLCAAAVILLGACDMFLQNGKYPAAELFWAYNFVTKKSYQLHANLLYIGEKCLIYAENGSPVTKTDAAELSREYDEKIYNIMEIFGETNFTVDGKLYKNTLEYASSVTKDTNKKLTILLLDIKDGYMPGPNSSYIAGYFDPNNFYTGHDSNKKNMMYIDTYPGLSNKNEMYSTLAHELQHLVNWVNSILKRPSGYLHPYGMDTWINEGLSMMAEYIYQGAPLASRINWFNDDKEGTIAWGNNFYVWDNFQSDADYPDAVLDDYATAYMFFHWLYLQANKNNNLLKEIGLAPYYDYRAVTEKAESIQFGWSDWETLLKTWMAANYINDAGSVYGYRGEEAFENIVIRSPLLKQSDVNKKIQLLPGEGVYSTITGAPFTPGSPAPNNPNIKYAGLDKSASLVNDTGLSYTGDVLLTFNKRTIDSYNSSDRVFTEEGFLASREDHEILSGELPEPPISSIGRFAAYYSSRVRIDANDLLRRRNPPASMPAPQKTKKTAHEN
jgi:hypothetical protein